MELPVDYIERWEESILDSHYTHEIYSSRVGILDVVGLASERPTCLMLPTIEHAIAEWNVYRTAISEQHGVDNCSSTRTTMIMKRTHSHLRLWCPFAYDLTMPLDWWNHHLGYIFVSPYFSKREMRRIVSGT